MRKLTALLLTVCLLFSFTSCGANTQYGDNVYTVYEGTEYETKIGLALKIENYLIDNPGELVPFFSIGYLAKDLGWHQNGNPNFNPRSELFTHFSHSYSDQTQIVFIGVSNYSESTNLSAHPQMKSFEYHLAPEGKGKYKQYAKKKAGSSKKNLGISVKFKEHPEKICYYTSNKLKAAGISKDDAVIIAYVLASAVVKPGENPFVGTRLEKAKTSETGDYIEYTLP